MHRTTDEMRSMKLVNMVEMRMEQESGGWEYAPEENGMTLCMTCGRSIHPAHHLVETTVDALGKERHAECESCFYTREDRDLPRLKKRNLRQIMADKKEAERMKRKWEEERERLRALPPPQAPLWQKVLKAVTGVDLAEVWPAVFGLKIRADLFLDSEDDAGEAWEDDVPVSQVKTRWGRNKFLNTGKPQSILKSKRATVHKGFRKVMQHSKNSRTRTRTSEEEEDSAISPEEKEEGLGTPPDPELPSSKNSIKNWATGGAESKKVPSLERKRSVESKLFSGVGEEGAAGAAVKGVELSGGGTDAHVKGSSLDQAV